MLKLELLIAILNLLSILFELAKEALRVWV